MHKQLFVRTELTAPVLREIYRALHLDIRSQPQIEAVLAQHLHLIGEVYQEDGTRASVEDIKRTVTNCIQEGM